MKHLKLFFYSLYGSIYIRIVMGYIRWFYYYKIKRNFKALDIKDAIEGTVNHNKTAFLKFPITDYTMKRMDRLIAIIKSMEFIGDHSHILIIGPRTDSDIMKIIYNYPQASIKAIDIISYSPWIDLQDAHHTTYSSNTFDCILSGWVLKYSNHKEKMMTEMIRIVKNEGLIAIGIEYFDSQIDTFNKTKSSSYFKEDENFEEVNSVKDIEALLIKIKVNYRIVFEYDALLKQKTTEELYRLTKLHSTQVMVCFQIFK